MKYQIWKLIEYGTTNWNSTLRIIPLKIQKPHDVEVTTSILKIMVKYYSLVRVSRSYNSYHVSFKLVVAKFFPSNFRIHLDSHNSHFVQL